MGDPVMTPTDRARLLAIEAGLIDPAADGLSLAAMTPEARSEAARKSWLTRQRNKKAGAGEAKPKAEQQTVSPVPKAEQQTAAPVVNQPHEETQSGMSPKMLNSIGEGVHDCFAFTRKSGREAGLVIDANGNRLRGMVKGDKNSIALPVDGVTERGGVEMHSHSVSAAFSKADIAGFIDAQTAHSIVVDTAGTIYTMSKPPGWSRAKASEKVLVSGSKNAEELYDRRMAEVRKARGAPKSLDKADAMKVWADNVHDAAERMCAELGLVYSRKKK